MSVERGVMAFAGFMVLLSVALAYFVHPGFAWLTVFVGANLFQQSFTGFCPAAMVMRKLGMRSERELTNAPIELREPVEILGNRFVMTLRTRTDRVSSTTAARAYATAMLAALGMAAVLPPQSLVAQETDGDALRQVDPLLEQSRALAGELGTRLRSALTEAVAKDGAAAAIAVCKDLAPQIAAELSARSGATVGRTSDRVRNPGNAAAPWQRTALESFAAAIANGASPASLEAFERSGAETRYMKPIVTDAFCLACHGDDLAPEVRAKLAEHYPGDRATGYAAGELRGAFVVSWPVGRP